MLALVVAQARGGVIGKANELPWYLPADLRHFKSLTTGHTVIMGRKTWDSIVARLGHALPDRTNIVITRDLELSAPGAVVVHSLDEALAKAGPGDRFVIGGAQVYRETLPVADRIYLTKIEADVDGDVWFPELAAEEWTEIEQEAHEPDEKNHYPYAFITLDRRA